MFLLAAPAAIHIGRTGGLIMSRSANRPDFARRILAACALLVAFAVQAHAAEPSRGMLGLIPHDEEGIVIIKDVYQGGPASRRTAPRRSHHRGGRQARENGGRPDRDARSPRSRRTNRTTRQPQRLDEASPREVGKARRSLQNASQPDVARPRAPGETTIINRHRILDDPAERRRTPRWSAPASQPAANTVASERLPVPQ